MNIQTLKQIIEGAEVMVGHSLEFDDNNDITIELNDENEECAIICTETFTITAKKRRESERYG